jgi:hypothetical protein
MIKFRAMQENGRELVGLGLSDNNLDKLRQGMPIAIGKGRNDIGLPFDILIFHGETEQDIVDKLRQEGLVDDSTTVKMTKDREQ